MKFREYMAARGRLAEADLLGAPSTSPAPSPPKPSQKTGPEEPPDGDEGEGGTARPTPRPDGQLQRAAVLIGELWTVLARLPHPWDKKLHGYLLPLQELKTKLEEVGG